MFQEDRPIYKTAEEIAEMHKWSRGGIKSVVATPITIKEFRDQVESQASTRSSYPLMHNPEIIDRIFYGLMLDGIDPIEKAVLEVLEDTNWYWREDKD